MNRMNPKPVGEESKPKVPTDLRQALAAAPMAKAKWSDLTPIARRDFISWIRSCHLTFAPWSPCVIGDFKVRLGKFVVKMNLFQIPVDWEIDRELVKDLVRARLAELD